MARHTLRHSDGTEVIATAMSGAGRHRLQRHRVQPPRSGGDLSSPASVVVVPYPRTARSRQPLVAPPQELMARVLAGLSRATFPDLKDP